jgi:hypothetical protein
MQPAQIKPPVSPNVLNQIDIRVGTILSVTDVPNLEKLVALDVSFGDHKRTVLTGMKRERANPREIEGKQALLRRESCAKEDGGYDLARHAFRHRLFGWDHSGAGCARSACAGRNQSRIMLLTQLGVRYRLRRENGEEGFGCREKQGCLHQAQVPLFVVT